MTVCRTCKEAYPAKEWEVLNSDLQCVPCRRAHLRKWREARRSAGRPVVTGKASAAATKRWFSQPDEKMRLAVRAKTRRAIASGRLQKQPCRECGAAAEAHHDDYTKPLEVIWFCRSHHAAHHADMRLATGAGQ